jgi:hypothetical protein
VHDEIQDEADHDYESNEINETVHYPIRLGVNYETVW